MNSKGAIFLVRHGECLDNANKILNGHRDTALTELGKKQAKAAGKKLKKENIKIIYTSPLKRTLETAQIIADELGIEVVQIDKGLIERNFGFMAGKPVAKIKSLTKHYLDINKVTYFLDGQGVETFPKLLARAKRVLKRLTAKHKKDNILLVTHGDTGMMIRAVYYKWDWLTGLKESFWRNGEIIKLM